jgi:hypothetical protein
VAHWDRNTGTICSWAALARSRRRPPVSFQSDRQPQEVGVDDPGLEDRVADNVCKFDITESETLLFGTNFGIATDIQTGPNGNLFVVSLSNGAVYEIFRRSSTFDPSSRSEEPAFRQMRSGFLARGRRRSSQRRDLHHFVRSRT